MNKEELKLKILYLARKYRTSIDYIKLSDHLESEVDEIVDSLPLERPWILVSERLPEKKGWYQTTLDGEWNVNDFDPANPSDSDYFQRRVLAWRNLPTPYMPTKPAEPPKLEWKRCEDGLLEIASLEIASSDASYFVPMYITLPQKNERLCSISELKYYYERNEITHYCKVK